MGRNTNLERFLKISLRSNDAEPHLDKVERWAESMENVFETFGCTEEEKVKFAVFKL